MATIDLFFSVFNFPAHPIPPGGIGSGMGWGPDPTFGYSAITVTAHAGSGGDYDLEVVQMTTEVRGEDNERYIWFAVKNHSSEPIYSLIAYASVIRQD